MAAVFVFSIGIKSTRVGWHEIHTSLYENRGVVGWCTHLKCDVECICERPIAATHRLHTPEVVHEAAHPVLEPRSEALRVDGHEALSQVGGFVRVRHPAPNVGSKSRPCVTNTVIIVREKGDWTCQPPATCYHSQVFILPISTCCSHCYENSGFGWRKRQNVSRLLIEILLLAIVMGNIHMTYNIHIKKLRNLVYLKSDGSRLTCEDATERLDEETQSIALVPGRDLRTPEGHEAARLEGEICVCGAATLRVLRPALVDGFPLCTLHLDLQDKLSLVTGPGQAAFTHLLAGLLTRYLVGRLAALNLWHRPPVKSTQSILPFLITWCFHHT